MRGKTNLQGLHLAAANGHAEVVELLLTHESSKGQISADGVNDALRWLKNLETVMQK